MGDDTGAVACSRIGADGSTVLKVAEGVECERDDVVAGSLAQGRDHRQAAGVPFTAGVVETLRRGHAAEPGEGWFERHETVLTYRRGRARDGAGPLMGK